MSFIIKTWIQITIRLLKQVQVIHELMIRIASTALPTMIKKKKCLVFFPSVPITNWTWYSHTKNAFWYKTNLYKWVGTHASFSFWQLHLKLQSPMCGDPTLDWWQSIHNNFYIYYFVPNNIAPHTFFLHYFSSIGIDPSTRSTTNQWSSLTYIFINFLPF